MTDKETLKLALEALENLFGIPDKFTGEGGGDVAVWRLGGSYRAQQTIAAIRARLEQPEQEPAAWINWSALTGVRRLGWECESEIASEPLYTTPQQRQWVGLTEEEIVSINDQHYNIAFRDFDADVAIARDIEVKLKEMNHG
jgi:hypothetical protein